MQCIYMYMVGLLYHAVYIYIYIYMVGLLYLAMYIHQHYFNANNIMVVQIIIAMAMTRDKPPYISQGQRSSLYRL